MNIKITTCKTALSKSTLPGLDYSLNPYRGCQHSCAYCYVPNVLRIDRDSWGSFIDIKINIPIILSREIKKKKIGTVGISTVTDPYQSIEERYLLTRYCLEELLKYDFPICIQTKSKLVLRDIDLISKFSNVEVMVSIGTIKDDERKVLEPYSSSINERLHVLKRFSEIGVKTTVFFGPIYPTVKVEDLSRIVDVFIDHGAKEIVIDKFNLKPGVKESIERKIANNNIMQKAFLKNIFETQIFFKKIKKEMHKLSAIKGIKIIDAF